MPVISPDKLVTLQRVPDRIRNICILAHVDHGKTSLTDALLATNGIISPKLAGKVRYLDSRPDEQLRGITMESSAISLYFSLRRRKADAETTDESDVEEYLINLIDSPGHIDFQSEVSTASRLCDGAVVLVDAVEGVCSQTVTVLRQTWVEKLKPVLVINKMDRLITELKMTASEAFVHLSKLLEQVNAVVGSFYQGERMEEDLRWREKMEERVKVAATKALERDAAFSDVASQATSVEAEYEEKDDDDLYFAPERNNVIFGSAIDGWAFTVKQFAGMYEKKLGIKRTVLEKVLWGDFYLDPKTKRVLGSKHLKGRNLKPMFVQLVLENIWAAYKATVGDFSAKGDDVLLEKILKSLQITLPNHVLKSRDPHNILTALFSKWLPLSTAILISVIEQLPSPLAAQETRMPALLESSPDAPSISSEFKDIASKFTPDSKAPILAFVSKMVAVKESELPRNKRAIGKNMSSEEARDAARRKRAEIAKAQAAADQKPDDTLSNMVTAVNSLDITEDETAPEEEKEDPEHFIGFARLYSGTLTTGSDIYVIPPKYSPAHSDDPPAIKVKVEALYLLMGRALEPLDSVPAGTIFGIEGLETALLKQGTLCSSATGAPNLAGIASTQAAPIVRVALEPEWPGDLNKMIEGLKMLERSDPCAIYEFLESGEHILATAGELHLERCLKDLRERFARCEIQVGEPIVPYREGIVNQPSISGQMAVGPRGTARIEVGKGAIIVELRVRPLPKPVIDFLVQQKSTIKSIVAEKREGDSNGNQDHVDSLETVGETDSGQKLSSSDFSKGLKEAFDEMKSERESWKGVLEKIISFGPRRTGPNLLIDSTGQMGKAIFSKASSNEHTSFSEAADKITYAFHQATFQGPLSNEPMQGVAISIHKIEVKSVENESSNALDNNRITSELIKATREAIRSAFLEWSPRIWLAVYRCEIQASTEVLGRVYPVLTRRHAHILSETLQEASNVYTITSLLPLHESFGFSDEIRKRTSGGASAQMFFHGFEVLDEDPFWVPATEEEKEDLGDTADRENRAKAIVDRIRDRKGLLVLGRKLDAEKERNLKR